MQPLSRQRAVASNTNTGNILSDQDGLGRTTSFAYDGFGRQTQVTAAEGNYILYGYDSRGNVVSQTAVAKPGSGVANVTTGASFDSTCFNLKTCNQPNTTTDPRGNVTNYSYDANSGGVTTVTRPAPASGGIRPETRYAYTPLYAYYMNSSGNLVQAPTPIYKLASNSTCQTAASCPGTADEIRSTYAYGTPGVANNLLQTSASTGPGDGAVTATTTMTYGVVGNLKTVDGPLPGTADTTSYAYNPDRQLQQITGPDPDGPGVLKNRGVKFGYDADGQVITVLTGTTDASGTTFGPIEARVTAYDTLGRKVRESLQAVKAYTVTQYSYDDGNRLDCVAVRMNEAAFSSLPPSACSLGAQGGFGPDRITKYTYDVADEVTKVTTGYGVSGQQRDDATSTYSANGKLATIADGNGNLTTYIYDGLDRLSQTQLPSKTNVGTSDATDYEQLTYDAASNVTNKRLRNGNNIGYAYDNLNRLTGKTLPAGNGNLNATFAYDNLDRVRQANNGNPVYSTTVAAGYGFNAQGPVSTETSTLNNGSALTKVSQYDVAGRRTRLTWPDNFYVTYEYDAVDEMTAIRENGSLLLATYTYNDLGKRLTLARGNGTATQYSYQNGSYDSPFLTSLQLTAPVGTTYTFSYSPAGEIAQRSSTNDAFAWSAAKNMNQGYTANGLNQYTTIGGVSPDPTYTPRGDLASLNGVTYSYSAESELATANTTRFYYDALHRMVYIAASPATKFDYDGSALLSEYNVTGGIIRRYVHGPGVDEPLVWYEGTGTNDRRWLAADERGSIVSLTSDTGASQSINAYDEYGNPGPNNNGRFQYTGQAWISELGMYNYKARIYAPKLGRFLQTDPIGYGDGPNWYNYAHGDPVNMVDPSGTVAGVDDIVVTATLIHLAPAVVAGVGTAIASFGHAIGHAIHCIFGCHHAKVASHVVPSASVAEASSGDNITVFANRAVPDSLPFYNNGLRYVANPYFRASSVWVDRALLAAPVAIGAGAAAIPYLAAEGGAAVIEGASSLYDTSITRAGSQYLNVQTDVGAQQFQSNLLSNGYNVATQTPGATILNNGTNTFTIYTRTSTGLPGAQFFGGNGSIIKYSLGGP